MIKVIAMKETPSNMTVYFLNLTEPKAFQLNMVKFTQQKIDILATYNTEEDRFEEVTLLFTKRYLDHLMKQLTAQIHPYHSNVKAL
ncbi:hypothetical protein FS935_07990 [Metabacillus litoralis]|uniref:Uncharacterized protein n=1 Tax=Metabacillus litoralis TaxID=152268 RepID=A0A5C6W705_9BACI|nr:hypothetical protein [Metabacillus litoralis]TXC91567.1 hypothetical protein FS935_07990 [Metabacillus litoralis]